MNRRAFILGTAGALALPALARAEPAKSRRRVRIGYLSAREEMTAASGVDHNLVGFRDGMLALGYVEGVDYRIEARNAARDYSAFVAFRDELESSGVDVIIAAGPASQVARAGGRVPLIFAFSGDPVDAGMVNSLARPGGNATGVALLALDLAAKRVEILKDAFPQASKLAVLGNPQHPGYQSELRVTRTAAQALGIDVTFYPTRSGEDFDRAFAAIDNERCDCLLAFPEATTTTYRRRIIEFTLEHRLVNLFGWKLFAEAGGLMTYGPNLQEAYARLAVYVDKVLKGERPAELPVEQPTRLEFVLNQKTARAIGLTLPPSILLRADEVIE